MSNKVEVINQLPWIQLEAILRNEILPFADCDEILIYNHIIELLNTYNSNFPSVLRNKLNYPSESSILDLENTLPTICYEQIQNDFDNNVFNLNTRDYSLETQIKATAIYSNLVFNLMNKLYSEYKTRSKLNKDFQIERYNYLKTLRLESIEI